MRNILIVAASVLPMVSAMAAQDVPAVKPRPVNGGSDLTLVLVVAANFYCEKQRWPANMEETLAYRESARIRTELKISELWLRSSEVRIITDASFHIRARDFLKDKPVIVVASQSKPTCEKGEATTVEADMHLDPDGEL
jgi:hypothetical protein